MICSVYNCKNSYEKGGKWRFFSFPKDEIIQQKWIDFCNQPSDMKIKKSTFICSAHFTSEDYERNLRYEMGFSAQKPKLRAGTVPTVYIFDDVEMRVVDIENSSRAIESSHSCAKCLSTTSVDNFALSLTETEEASALEQNKRYLIETVIVDSPVVYNSEQRLSTSSTVNVEDNSSVNHEDALIYASEAANGANSDIANLQYQIRLLKEAEEKELQEINNLKINLQSAELQRNNMEAALKSIFSEGQLFRLKKGKTKRHKWKNEDKLSSINLYSIYPQFYLLLRRHKFPLPSVRTLQFWREQRTD